ncbi:MAG: tetratricopeptide repeat protein [Muribaculaceae bacterium]|nr:tetratricopeptide repeat protein [Muribaculaceae bacterium]
MRAIFRTFIMVATMLAIMCPMSAQTLQKGVVQEYRGKSKKTPLSNVELSVVNASSTVSDKKGCYELQFRTLKPGNKVNVRKIEKLGYEIFNKEALEQWYISSQNESFTIVMVRCEDIKKLRDEYSRVSSQSYERQYNRDKKKLEEERKQNKLTQQEYENKIKALEEEYDYQLTQLDNYVDRFSRIDLSELSKEEQEIIELVRQGEIDEAIKHYEELGIDNKIHEIADEKSEIDHAIATLNSESSKKSKELDQLFVSLSNMFDTYLLRGGQDGYKKIVEICFSIAKNDNIPADYKTLLPKYLKYVDEIKYYQHINFEEINNKHLYLWARSGYGIVLHLMGQYEQALEQYQIAYSKAKEWGYNDEMMSAEICIAQIYSDSFKTEKASEIFLKYEERLNNKDDLTIDDIYLCEALFGLISYYQQVGDYSKMLKYSEEAYNIAFNLYQKKPINRHEYNLLNGLSIYILSLRVNNKIEDAFILIKETLPISEKFYKKNPKPYCVAYLSNLQTLGEICFALGKYDESEQAFIKAISVIKEAEYYLVNEIEMIAYACAIYNNLGYLYSTLGDKEKSEQAYLQSIEAGNKRIELSGINLLSADAIFRPGINIATLYNSIENYEKAKQYGSEAFKYCELLYSNYPDAYINEYILILKELAIADMNLDSCDSALEFIEKAIQVFPANSYDTSSFLTNNYAELLDVKGQILLKKGDNDGAAEMMKKIKKAMQTTTHN